MLGKLMKHELKATSRMLLPIYFVLVVLTIMDRIVISLDIYNNALTIILGFITFAYVVSLIAIVVVSAVIIILRFYKNMVTDEGYLMFTLPVKPSQLILSKLIISILWTIASVAAVLISLLGVFATPDRMSMLGDGIQMMMNELTNTFGEKTVVLLVIEFIVLIIISIINSILEIYASIAVGQLFNGHKVLGSFASFIAISMIVQVISTLFVVVAGLVIGKSYNELNAIPQILFPFTILFTLLFNVLYFWLTNYLFKRKLNLE